MYEYASIAFTAQCLTYDMKLSQVSWQTNDGIKSSVVGLLSSGISGIPFNHSDIGGYCGVDMPFLKYKRSEELLLRWMELNAFSVVFRTHEVSISPQFWPSDLSVAYINQ